jgi:biopolymer transport protein ExbB
MDAWLAGVRDLVERGGLVMPPLVAAALVLWFALGYRLLTLRRGSALDLRALIGAARAGRRPRGIVDAAVVRGLDLVRAGGPRLRAHLDEAFGPLEDRLGRLATVATAIVVVSPLLGLLGTVSGMIETFDSLAEMAMFRQSGGIAAGVAEALVTTQMGLSVAIPGLVVGRLLARRQQRLEGELARVKELLCALAREGDGVLAGRRAPAPAPAEEAA